MKRKESEKGSVRSSETTSKVPVPDQMVSGDAGTDSENNDEQAEGNGGTSPRLVERMTGLRGLSIGKRRVATSTIRARTESDLRQTDAEIPYLKTEKAIRDLVCSLMERQDRMNEAIFLKLIDLEYRVDDSENQVGDLEKCLDSAGIQRSGSDKGS
jgi:hypothetical protein